MTNKLLHSLAMITLTLGLTQGAQAEMAYPEFKVTRSYQDLTPQQIARAEKLGATCYMGCHRPARENVVETLSPKLEGLPAQYFISQWIDFDAERFGGIASQMKLTVYKWPVDIMEEVALVYANKEMSFDPNPEVVASDAYKRGKKLYDKACKMCHGEQGLSTKKANPTIRGQMPTYMFETMGAYRDGIRNNRKARMMQRIAKLYTEDQWRDMIAYTAGEFVKHIERIDFPTGKGMPTPPGFRLPDTGQVQDFTDTRGEDSDHPKHPQQFQISDSGLTAFDTNTKLTWERKTSRLWMNAAEAVAHCDSLEIDGYSDWRLPFMKELVSIADYGEFRPAINTDVFLNMPRMNSGIWALPISDHKDHVWHVGFPDAHIMGQHTASTKLVRCVRADNNGGFHANDFVDNGDNTVTDKVTQLQWQQVISDQRRNWEASIDYCQNLNLAGKQDWRLPNIKELVSIVNYNEVNPSIEQTFFPNTPYKYYFWSSTSDIGGPMKFFRPLTARKPQQHPEEQVIRNEHGVMAWGIGFQIGDGQGQDKQSDFWTRCVRDL
ncbi:DUF1566 domain-containing protein [Ferrimonas sp. SCSIO 43195]|uniref:Lcl domain-containing protein n=1 Tax=Ferrimonas sp. SCSIO 43195 TaxID=2822844 RepID=UPI002074BEAE|nr:DUF1566 domain-containing protein [Ferrimonas sp. SCSIO 43195]USD39365.1 DUF1566 domain-containing protein [Ferrimonas sp. SCSIO 43195]